MKQGRSPDGIDLDVTFSGKVVSGFSSAPGLSESRPYTDERIIKGTTIPQVDRRAAWTAVGRELAERYHVLLCVHWYPEPREKSRLRYAEKSILDRPDSPRTTVAADQSRRGSSSSTGVNLTTLSVRRICP